MKKKEGQFQWDYYVKVEAPCLTDYLIMTTFVKWLFTFESIFSRIKSSFVDTSIKHWQYQLIFETKYYGASSCLKNMYFTLKTIADKMERGERQDSRENLKFTECDF